MASDNMTELDELSMAEIAATPFDSILEFKSPDQPSNSKLMQRAANAIPFQRICIHILGENDETLKSRVVDKAAADTLLELYEDIGRLVDYEKSVLEIYEASQTRLLIAMAAFADRTH